MFEDARSLRRLAGCLVAPGAADDLVQDTLIVGAKQAEAPSQPWLRGVMRNLARMRHREAARRRVREETADLSRDEATPDEQVHRMRVQRALCDAVLELPETYRNVIVLHHFDGLSLADIARREDAPEGTIRWRHKEALDRLRAALDAQNGGDRKAWLAALAPLARLELPGGPVELDGPAAAAGKTFGLVKIAAILIAIGAAGAVAVVAMRGSDPTRGESQPPSELGAAPAAAPHGSSAPHAAPPPPALGSAEDLSNDRDRAVMGDGALPAPPAHYELTQITDTAVAVALGGGKSGVFVPPYGPKSERGEHTITGTVTDAHGAPVAGAVVVVGDALMVHWGQLLANAGATTGADGRFTIEHAPSSGLAIALHPSGWSPIVKMSDQLDLTIPPNGSIAGQVRYGNQPIQATLHLVPHGLDRVMFTLDSAPDGRYRIPTLAPGDYDLTAGPTRGIAGGSNKPGVVTLHVAPGAALAHDFELAEGVLLVVHGVAPAGRTATIVDAFLLSGHHAIADRAALEQLVKTLPADAHDELLHGGIDAPAPIQFHDRTPGPYTVCAETRFDGGTAFGCTTIDLAAAPNARELDVVTR